MKRSYQDQQLRIQAVLRT